MSLRETSADVPGKVILDHTIPRQEYLGVRLAKGQVLRVIDIEGEQVMDTAVLNASDPSEHASMPWTNFLNKTWRLKKGHTLYSIRCAPLVKIIEDTVGQNYSGGGFCTAESNFTRYGVPHTRNCGDNLANALAKFGISRHYCAESSEFALFMNVGYDNDGTCEIRPPSSKAGDFADLEALMDVTIGLSCCPQERNPCNNFRAKPMRVIVYQR